AAIFIVLVVTIFAVATSTLLSAESVLAVKNQGSLKAFYIASAGVEYYLKELSDDPSWLTPPVPETKSFSGGIFTVAYTGEADSAIAMLVTGIYTVEGETNARALKMEVARSNGQLSVLNWQEI
ncbi:MAG: hypothetical protein ABID35_03550, partial [Candidatus Margulisiibacteriota bacterium]